MLWFYIEIQERFKKLLELQDRLLEGNDLITASRVSILVIGSRIVLDS